MLEWLRRNNKRVLAVLGVLLMIAFLAPNFGGNPGAANNVIGYVGDEKITAIDFEQAKY